MYLTQVYQTLPRLLALFDGDETSQSYGVGDRYYWAWGLIDFGNGTFQGAAHGMARLWRSGLWPFPTPRDQFIHRIDGLFIAADKLTRRDGSLEEAFPYEGSYCVTALVAFDLLCTLDLLGEEIDVQMKERWKNIIDPMIKYLIKTDETHAFISNHLATAVAALVRWHQLTQDAAAESRADQLLERILNHQSDEGWFMEYEGADPGYQSLCTYYLADVHLLRPDLNLLEPLRKSVRFLWFFAHPDGSFGGGYGSRCTRFYYPAGVLSLANEIAEAKSLAQFMENSIQEQSVVTLLSMDEPNLIPMFNAYCWAAELQKEMPVGEKKEVLELPALASKPFRQHFSDSGIIIDRGLNHYSIISTHKGGVVYHFVGCKMTVLNAGVVVLSPKGEYGSSQSWHNDNELSFKGNAVSIDATITAMPKKLPSVFQFIVLRILCITLFRFATPREWVKQLLVHFLITGGKKWPVCNVRTIQMGEDLSISDDIQMPLGYTARNIDSFVPIHMASQGYWQIQDEEEGL